MAALPVSLPPAQFAPDGPAVLVVQPDDSAGSAPSLVHANKVQSIYTPLSSCELAFCTTPPPADLWLLPEVHEVLEPATQLQLPIDAQQELLWKQQWQQQGLLDLLLSFVPGP